MPHKDFRKIIINFINGFGLFENKTQDKLKDHNFGPSTRYQLFALSPGSYCTMSRGLLSLCSSRLACFLLKKPWGRQRNGKQSLFLNRRIYQMVVEARTWVFFLYLFCPVHQQKSSTSRPSTSFHLKLYLELYNSRHHHVWPGGWPAGCLRLSRF